MFGKQIESNLKFSDDSEDEIEEYRDQVSSQQLTNSYLKQNYKTSLLKLKKVHSAPQNLNDEIQSPTKIKESLQNLQFPPRRRSSQLSALKQEISYKIFWNHAIENILLNVSISLPNTSTIKCCIKQSLQQLNENLCNVHLIEDPELFDLYPTTKNGQSISQKCINQNILMCSLQVKYFVLKQKEELKSIKQFLEVEDVVDEEFLFNNQGQQSTALTHLQTQNSEINNQQQAQQQEKNSTSYVKQNLLKEINYLKSQ